MLTATVLLGIGCLVLPALTYFATKYWDNKRHIEAMQAAEKRHKEENSEQRISKVVDKYLEYSRKHITNGLDGMQKAGAASLLDDLEIRKAVEMIENSGEKDPLQRKGFPLDEVDLKIFFVEVAKSRLNLFRGEKILKLIERLKG